MSRCKGRFAAIPILVLVCLSAVARSERPTDAAGNKSEGAFYFLTRPYRPPQLALVKVSDRGIERVDLRAGRIELTERQAILLAIESNLDVQIERLAPERSRWEVLGARSILDTRLDVNASRDRQRTPASSLLAGGDSITQIVDLLEAGATKLFSRGTEASLKARIFRFETSSIFTSLNPAINTELTLSLVQPLLKNYGRSTTLWRVRQAENNHAIAQADFEQAVENVVAGVRRTYWELAHDREEIAVREKAVELARVTLENNRRQLENGVAARLDVIQAEAEVAARQERLIAARYRYRIDQDQLKTQLTSSLAPEKIVGEIVPLEPLADVAAVVLPSGEEALEQALRHRRDVRRQELEIDNRRIQERYTANQLRPQLDLLASYTQFGLGGNRLIRDFSGGNIFTAPTIGIDPSGIGRSYRELFGGDFLGWLAGVRLTVWLDNDRARADSARAQLEVREQEMRGRALRQRISLEVQTALNLLEMNRARLESARESVRFLHQRIDGEQAKFENGLATTRDLIEAQRDLALGESLALRARVDWIQSLIELQRAMGTILLSQHIEIGALKGERPDAVNR
ncbi:MAG: TolC family protein [Acidobacteriota bacterium]